MQNSSRIQFWGEVYILLCNLLPGPKKLRCWLGLHLSDSKDTSLFYLDLVGQPLLVPLEKIIHGIVPSQPAYPSAMVTAP